MIEFFDSIISSMPTNTIVLILYWLPMAICIVGYTIRTWANYKRDVIVRGEYELALASKVPGEVINAKYYIPTDRIGDMAVRIIASVVPVLNIWAAVVNLLPEFINEVVFKLSMFLSKPLVPRK